MPIGLSLAFLSQDKLESISVHGITVIQEHVVAVHLLYSTQLQVHQGHSVVPSAHLSAVVGAHAHHGKVGFAIQGSVFPPHKGPGGVCAQSTHFCHVA